jgi:hypothetical protein
MLARLSEIWMPITAQMDEHIDSRASGLCLKVLGSSAASFVHGTSGLWKQRRCSDSPAERRQPIDFPNSEIGAGESREATTLIFY